MFKHPNYYKNLRKLARLRNRDQAISLQAETSDAGRTPGTGLKQSNNAGTLISRLCNKRKGGIGSGVKSEEIDHLVMERGARCTWPRKEL